MAEGDLVSCLASLGPGHSGKPGSSAVVREKMEKNRLSGRVLRGRWIIEGPVPRGDDRMDLKAEVRVRYRGQVSA